MCYNCGCEIPEDDMGRGHVHAGGASLTEEDIRIMAKKSGMSVEDTKKNILNLLKKELGE